MVGIENDLLLIPAELIVGVLLVFIYPVRLGIRLAQWRRASAGEGPLRHSGWTHPAWILLDITLIPIATLIFAYGFYDDILLQHNTDKHRVIIYIIISFLVFWGYLVFRNDNWEARIDEDRRWNDARSFEEEQDEWDWASGVPPYERHVGRHH